MVGGERRLLYPVDLVGRLSEELHHAGRTWARHVELLPEGDEVRALLETCFLGSLLEEEGRPITFTLAFTPSSGTAEGAEALVFSKPLPLSHEAIRRLAPALQPERTHIATERTPHGLIIWGLVHFGRPALPSGERHSPSYVTFHVRRTAEFEVRLMTSTLLRYSKGSGSVMGQSAQHNEARLVAFLGELLPMEVEVEERQSAALCLYDIARELQRRGHGGIVLVVGSGAQPIGLDLHEHFTPTPGHSIMLARHLELSLKHPRPPRAPFGAGGTSLGARFALQRMREAIEFVVSLASIDGALVLDTRLNILGFGARIRLVRASESLPVVHRLDPERLSAAEVMPIPEFLGMRHRSAIQFCQMQEGPAVALVVSQDGSLSLMARSRLDADKVVAAIPLDLDIP